MTLLPFLLPVPSASSTFLFFPLFSLSASSSACYRLFLLFSAQLNPIFRSHGDTALSVAVPPCYHADSGRGFPSLSSAPPCRGAAYYCFLSSFSSCASAVGHGGANHQCSHGSARYSRGSPAQGTGYRQWDLTWILQVFAWDCWILNVAFYGIPTIAACYIRCKNVFIVLFDVLIYSDLVLLHWISSPLFTSFCGLVECSNADLLLKREVQ